MAGLIRDFDWSKSSLGPVEKWTPTLLLTINTLLATHHPMVLLWGPEFVHFYNDGFRKSIGPDKHPSCLGAPAQRCWPDTWERMQPKIAAVVNVGESSWFENHYQPIFYEGKLRDAWWTYSYSPVRDGGGAICGVLILCHETTSLVLTERKLKSALQATTDGVLSVDRNWRINYLNQRATGILASVGELIGADLWAAFPSMIYEGSPYVHHYRRAMEDGVPAEFEAFYPEPLNLWAHIIVCPVVDGILFFFRDITQRKREYAALMQSEKLAAVGRMASSIAHEINNPLESLTNLLYLLQNLEEREQRDAFLKQAEGELNRIARITTQTLRFYRQSAQPQPVQLKDVLENVLSLMQGRLRSNAVSVTTEYRTERPVYGYEADLRQVFANFLSNALDASGRDGRIILRVEESTDPDTESPSVRVVIADNGHGMDRATSERIFEPFFTT
ncbi:MAG TPA: PAS domain-containing protein, partial [Acidobacteriaceae bacterium]